MVVFLRFRVLLCSINRWGRGQDRFRLDTPVRLFFRGARVLGTAVSNNRPEAGVFMMGFLVSLPEDDWEMRQAAVEGLRYLRTQRCAALLFSELERVKSSNTTRRYLDTIIQVLKGFPRELIFEKLKALAEDRSFSPKMRAKFERCLWGDSPEL